MSTAVEEFMDLIEDEVRAGKYWRKYLAARTELSRRHEVEFSLQVNESGWYVIFRDTYTNLVREYHTDIAGMELLYQAAKMQGRPYGAGGDGFTVGAIRAQIRRAIDEIEEKTSEAIAQCFWRPDEPGKRCVEVREPGEIIFNTGARPLIPTNLVTRSVRFAYVCNTD